MTIDPGVIGSGLAARLQQLTLAMERYDAFVFRPGTRPAAAVAHEGGPAARALVLRALRSCADASGWQVMQRLAESDASTGELAGLLRCPRLVAWEQVNELVQAGLAARDLEGDRVGLTPAGQGMVDLVEVLTAAAVAAAAARPAASRGGSGDELPVV